MKYLDPTIDIAFKRLFGNQAHSNIVISFLNSVLDLRGEHQIASVIITDPYNQPDTLQLKMSIVDVRCTDQKGRQFIVELQVAYQDFYLERSQYYTSLAITRQLPKGGRYQDLMPVIFIGILDFSLLDSSGYLHTHLITDKETNEHAFRHLSFTIIELPKFNKTIDEVETITDKWIYLLKHASEFDEPPQSFVEQAEFNDALNLLNQDTLNKKELAAYDRIVENMRAEENNRSTYMRLGLEKGRELGMEEGREKGREEGERQAKLKIAKALQDTMPIEQIAQVTGFSVDDLKKLLK